jgi:hypothetical protein
LVVEKERKINDKLMKIRKRSIEREGKEMKAKRR